MLLDTPKVMALKKLKTYPKDTPILDIGFGRGEVLLELKRLGFYSLWGTETSGKMVIEVGIKGVHTFLTEDPAPIIKIAKPTVTLCFEVIEHLESPEELLSQLPKGKLFLSTPNKDRWWPKLTGQYEAWDFPPNHFRRYEKIDIQRLLSRCGYQKIKVLTTPISYNRILQPISTWLAFKLGLKTNTEDYETVRGSKIPIRPLYRFARLASFPITIPMAFGLNKLGYVGESFYVEAEKE